MNFELIYKLILNVLAFFWALGELLKGSGGALGEFWRGSDMKMRFGRRPGPFSDRPGSIFTLYEGPKLGPSWIKNRHFEVVKTMQKSITKSMRLGIDFLVDFCGFGEPKRSHVGTQMELKMDCSGKTPKIKKIQKNQYNFNDFGGSAGPSWE